MVEKNTNMPSVDDQYQRLINARNYHYDNLNKWLMSFYAIIAALFIAFYSVDGVEYQIIISVLGYGVSILCLLSGKGYYYWEYKWIEKVHRYEKGVLKYDHDDKQVYSSFVLRNKHDNPFSPIDGSNISTTKVALAATTLIVIAWGCIAIIIGPFKAETSMKSILMALIASALMSYGLMLLGTRLFPSSLGPIDVLDKKNDVNEQKISKIRIFYISCILIAFLIITIGSLIISNDIQNRENDSKCESTSMVEKKVPTENLADSCKKITEG